MMIIFPASHFLSEKTRRFMESWWHNVAFVNTFIVGRKKTKKKTSFSFSLLWESGIRCLFCSGGKITCCWSQRFDKISWQTWAKLATMGNVGKSNLFHFKEKMRPPSSLTELCLSEMCAQWFHSAYLFGGYWLYWMIPRNGVTLLCTSANLLRHKMVH